MPQLDFSTFSPQIIWLAITFFALYLVMARSSLPKVSSILEERADRIADDLDEAERNKKESEKLAATNIEATMAARAEAGAHIQSAKDALNKRLEEKRQKIDQELTGQLNDAEARIEEAKRNALGDVETVAADACEQVIEKLLGRSLSRSDIDAAVKAEISRFNERGGI